MHASREGFCGMLVALVPGNGVISRSGKRETGGGTLGIDEGSDSTGRANICISRGLGGEGELVWRGDCLALDGAGRGFKRGHAEVERAEIIRS